LIQSRIRVNGSSVRIHQQPLGRAADADRRDAEFTRARNQSTIWAMRCVRAVDVDRRESVGPQADVRAVDAPLAHVLERRVDLAPVIAGPQTVRQTAIQAPCPSCDAAIFELGVSCAPGGVTLIRSVNPSS
jgi:hypothetical protein